MKYIIEIPDDVQYVLFNGKTDNKYYTAVRPVAELEVLNSDYINEHYGELQDEAYKRGYEDGKWKAEDGCDGCKYYEDTSLTNPCSECSRGHVDHYKPVSDLDRIEVGDEVVWSYGDTIVVTMTYVDGGVEWCDGVSKDGRACHVYLENVRKTGKHYDIASILEAMRT